MVLVVDLFSEQLSIIFLHLLVPPLFLLVPHLASLLADFYSGIDKFILFFVALIEWADVGLAMAVLVVE